MDRIKLLIISMLSGLAVMASSQSVTDPQWGTSPVGNVQMVKYSPTGEYVVTFGGGEVRLWRASTGALMWVRSVPNVMDAGFTPDAAKVLVGTDTVIKTFSSVGGLAGADFSSDPNARGYLAYSPDG